MFQQILQILTLLLTVAGGIVTQLWGFKAINKTFDDKLAATVSAIHEILKNKVDVEVYSATVKDLYESRNALAVKLAETEREVKVLNELLTMVLKKEN